MLIKEYLNLAGIENKNFAGHSLRSGFATVAADSGADERSIMSMTGHKTTQMVRRYIREANIFKNNALNKNKNLNRNPFFRPKISIIRWFKFFGLTHILLSKFESQAPHQ